MDIFLESLDLVYRDNTIDRFFHPSKVSSSFLHRFIIDPISNPFQPQDAFLRILVRDKRSQGSRMESNHAQEEQEYQEWRRLRRVDCHSR